MKKDIELTFLYDYYSALLTEKQKEYFQDYYFQDYSLNEIAENNSVSKNAVSKQIINTEKKLIEYEKKLKLLENNKIILTLIENKEYNKIKEYI